MFSYTECRNRVRLTFICEGAQRTYITDVDYRTAWQTFKGRWMKTTAIEDVDDGGERERLIRRKSDESCDCSRHLLSSVTHSMVLC